MEPPVLRLSSAGLLSKWGFNDGDMPEELLDYWDSIELKYPDDDWRGVLRELVRTYLLPELEKNHEIRICDIDTNHNPVRAEVVDGIAIDYYRDSDQLTLIPEHVDIPYAAVMAAFKTEGEQPR